MAKFSIIARLQHWMDSVPGQTFMNYAYSWGAAVVILGTLFKLTHIPGANAMLFIGMGTEVLVFFIAGFDRPFDAKTEVHLAEEFIDLEDQVTEGAEQQNQPDNTAATEGGNAIIGGGTVVGGGTIVLGGGPVVGGGTVVMGGTAQPVITESEIPEGTTTAAPVAGGSALSAADAANLAAASLAAAGAHASMQNVQDMIEKAQTISTPEVEEATEAYLDQLKQLTEALSKMEEQAHRMSADSTEMEQLNRNLTGINTIYEMQLKSISQQVGTIDHINEQTRRMARQIEELNAVYARMIEALTVNMPKV